MENWPRLVPPPRWTRLHLFLKAQTTLASDMDHLMVSDGDMIPARGIKNGNPRTEGFDGKIIHFRRGFSNAMFNCWRVLLTMGNGVSKIPPCYLIELGGIPTKLVVVTLAVSGTVPEQFLCNELKSHRSHIALHVCGFLFTETNDVTNALSQTSCLLHSYRLRVFRPINIPSLPWHSSDMLCTCKLREDQRPGAQNVMISSQWQRD